jgi:hypothetical protein
MIHSKKTVILSICLCLIHVVNAQVSPYEIKKGNPLRKTLLDVVRTPTSAELGQNVEFVVNTLLSKGDWAFVQGQLQQTGGKALDKTKFVDKDYLERGKEGLFDDNFQAVLQKKKGKWVIVKRALGCTDVCWGDWVNTVKGADKAIFPQ